YGQELEGKLGGSSWERILSLKCRYLALLNPFNYELFDAKGELELEAILDSHCSSRNAIVDLYVGFFKVDRVGPSSTNVAANA
ncbi:hypothetical protein J1N35_024837, partial [Gossypium stocksii]